MTVVDLLSRADAPAEALALVGAERTWTFRELGDALDARAEELGDRGHRPGEVVPCVIEPDSDGVIELLALWRMGAIPAPLNPRLTEPEREAARSVLASARVPAQAIVWTSGTAGRPRGVAISFEALRASARGAAERLRLGPRDVWLASLSPAHVGGLALVTRSLLLGGTLVAVGPCDAARAWNLLRGRGLPPHGAGPVTHVSVVPTQLRRLIDASGTEPPPPSFRCALVGGAETPRDLLARALLAGWPVALTYGLTEATSQVATAPPELTRHKAGSVGPPLPGVEVRILHGGEIAVRGPTLATAYVGEGAGSPVDEAGWHHTGDLGRLDADGDLWVLGRRVDRIVSGGVTVDAVEVEEALRAHASVADACVVGLPDAEWGERVAAWVEPAGRAPDREELDAHLRKRLSAAKLPRSYRVGTGIPRNPNGKVDRAAVRRALTPEA